MLEVKSRNRHSITVWIIIVSCCALFVNEKLPQIQGFFPGFFAPFCTLHKTPPSVLEGGVLIFVTYFQTVSGEQSCNYFRHLLRQSTNEQSLMDTLDVKQIHHCTFRL